MKIKGKILIPIFALVYLVVLAIASIPPPPVNQNFGIYDTTLTTDSGVNIYNETLCRGCHNSTASPLVNGGVPTRHHNLTANSVINPNTSQPFACQDCHPSTLGSGMGILLDRNCMDCHNGTAFWGDSIGARVGNFTRPHHNTTHAQARNCKFCHGASVDDYNDGHYVPSYPPSEVTPSALFNPNAVNFTIMRVWGGCLACHAENTTASPPIFFTQTDGFPPVANGHNNVHHSEINGITAVTVPGDNQCLWCHVNVVDVLNIRGCETCHSVRSIHNVQYDFANTSTKIGYGHIGSNNPLDVKNNSWDCKGCHAWYDAGDVNPFVGSIVPDVQSATPNVFNANTPTVVTLSGINFVQGNSTTVVNIDDTTNLTPDTMTNGQITVNVNLAAGAHYIKVVKTDATENVPKQSDIKPLTVVSVVTISSVTLNGGTLTLTGVGLGSQPASNAQQYVTFNHGGNVYYSDAITSWSGTQIVATVSGSVTVGDIAEVITTNSGQATATISAGATDTTPPVITVNGSNPVTIALGSVYKDAGATAVDAVDGSVPVTTTGTVNTNVVGTYILTYTATDKSGNTATAIRTVNVAKPVLTTITVSPSPATVPRKGTQTFTATANDQFGKAMSKISITWSSSNTNIGTVYPMTALTGTNGQATTRFTAKNTAGKTTVTAKSGTISGSSAVTVK